MAIGGRPEWRVHDAPDQEYPLDTHRWSDSQRFLYRLQTDHKDANVRSLAKQALHGDVTAWAPLYDRLQELNDWERDEARHHFHNILMDNQPEDLGLQRRAAGFPLVHSTALGESDRYGRAFNEADRAARQGKGTRADYPRVQGRVPGYEQGVIEEFMGSQPDLPQDHPKRPRPSQLSRQDSVLRYAHPNQANRTWGQYDQEYPSWNWKESKATPVGDLSLQHPSGGTYRRDYPHPYFEPHPGDSGYPSWQDEEPWDYSDPVGFSTPLEQAFGPDLWSAVQQTLEQAQAAGDETVVKVWQQAVHGDELSQQVLADYMQEWGILDPETALKLPQAFKKAEDDQSHLANVGEFNDLPPHPDAANIITQAQRLHDLEETGVPRRTGVPEDHDANAWDTIHSSAEGHRNRRRQAAQSDEMFDRNSRIAGYLREPDAQREGQEQSYREWEARVAAEQQQDRLARHPVYGKPHSQPPVTQVAPYRPLQRHMQVPPPPGPQEGPITRPHFDRPSRQDVYTEDSPRETDNPGPYDLPEYRGGLRPIYRHDGQPVRYSGIHAPSGGVVVRGVNYTGGKFIPNSEVEKANWDAYQHVQKQRAKYRRSDGSYDNGAAMTEKPVKCAERDTWGNYNKSLSESVNHEEPSPEVQTERQALHQEQTRRKRRADTSLSNGDMLNRQLGGYLRNLETRRGSSKGKGENL